METGGIKDDTVITKYPDFLSMVVNGACKDTDIAHINTYLDEFK